MARPEETRGREAASETVIFHVRLFAERFPCAFSSVAVTGTVGSHVVRELLPRKVEVSVLTRDASKAATLPAGAKAVVDDLGSAETVRRVFRDVDAVFLVTVVSPTEAHEG